MSKDVKIRVISESKNKKSTPTKPRGIKVRILSESKKLLKEAIDDGGVMMSAIRGALEEQEDWGGKLAFIQFSFRRTEPGKEGHVVSADSGRVKWGYQIIMEAPGKLYKILPLKHDDLREYWLSLGGTDASGASKRYSPLRKFRASKFNRDMAGWLQEALSSPNSINWVKVRAERVRTQAQYQKPNGRIVTKGRKSLATNLQSRIRKLGIGDTGGDQSADRFKPTKRQEPLSALGPAIGGDPMGVQTHGAGGMGHDLAGQPLPTLPTAATLGVPDAPEKTRIRKKRSSNCYTESAAAAVGWSDDRKKVMTAIQAQLLDGGYFSRGKNKKVPDPWICNGGRGPGDCGVDGQCGPITKEAIKAFQRDHKDADGKQLVDDGILGSASFPVLAAKASAGLGVKQGAGEISGEKPGMGMVARPEDDTGHMSALKSGSDASGAEMISQQLKKKFVEIIKDKFRKFNKMKAPAGRDSWLFTNAKYNTLEAFTSKFQKAVRSYLWPAAEEVFKLQNWDINNRATSQVFVKASDAAWAALKPALAKFHKNAKEFGAQGHATPNFRSSGKAAGKIIDNP